MVLVLYNALLLSISDAFIAGPAGTGHKIQSISVVFSTLHCEGYIADLRYRWLIEILYAILKSTRHGGQLTKRL